MLLLSLLKEMIIESIFLISKNDAIILMTNSNLNDKNEVFHI